MRISERQFGSARVFDFHGPLVGSEASRLVREALGPPADTGAGLTVVDLARVGDVDWDGLLSLGEAERLIRRAGGTLRVALPDDGRRPLMSRRIRALFDSFDSAEAALVDVRNQLLARRVRMPMAALVWAAGRWRRVQRRLWQPP